jgi:hypothetical protein
MDAAVGGGTPRADVVVYLDVDLAAGPVAFTLLAASAAPGRTLKIRCRGTAFAASIVGTIDGAAGPHVVPANTTVELHSDGAGWSRL